MYIYIFSRAWHRKKLKSKELGAALSQPSCLLLMMFIKGKINHRDIIKWQTLTGIEADIDVLQMGNKWKTKVLIVIKGEIKMNMMIDPRVSVLL